MASYLNILQIELLIQSESATELAAIKFLLFPGKHNPGSQFLWERWQGASKTGKEAKVNAPTLFPTAVIYGFGIGRRMWMLSLVHTDAEL